MRRSAFLRLTIFQRMRAFALGISGSPVSVLRSICLLLSQLNIPRVWLPNRGPNRMKRTSNRAPNGTDDLKIYIHDGATSLRFEIEGSLSGTGARELEQSWCTASSVIGNRSLVIAVGKVNR